MIKIYLTYSRMKDYLECPKRYKFKYVDKVQIQEDLYNACTGTIKQKIVEILYNEDWLFREKGDALKQKFKGMVPKLLQEWVESVKKAGNTVDLTRSGRSQQALTEEITRGVDQIFTIIKKDKLLVAPANFNRSEVDGVYEGRNFTLKGRIDLVVGDRSKTPVIVDGKDTMIEKGVEYNDPDQLYAYALMNHHEYGVYPSKLGFMMFRFNTVRWIDPISGIKGFDEKAAKVAENIKAGNYESKVGDACRWCKYKPKCKDYSAWVSTQGIKEETL